MLWICAYLFVGWAILLQAWIRDKLHGAHGYELIGILVSVVALWPTVVAKEAYDVFRDWQWKREQERWGK